MSFSLRPGGSELLSSNSEIEELVLDKNPAVQVTRVGFQTNSWGEMKSEWLIVKVAG
jgi:hypothetical protein